MRGNKCFCHEKLLKCFWLRITIKLLTKKQKLLSYNKIITYNYYKKILTTLIQKQNLKK